MIDCYAILGVSPSADDEAIKVAFLALHEEIIKTTIADSEEYDRRMAEIKAAFGLIAEPGRRKAYDKLMSSKKDSSNRDASMSGKCKSCGAEIEYAAGSQSLKCQYCGAVNEIKKAEDQLPSKVEVIIPLTVSQDDLEKRVYGFMASGNWTPDDMLEASTFTKKECFYVPAYLIRVKYEATWTASFGYDRKEPYTDYRTVTRNNRQHQEAYTAYRTVTDWKPANGVDSGGFWVSAYAGKSWVSLTCLQQSL